MLEAEATELAAGCDLAKEEKKEGKQKQRWLLDVVNGEGAVISVLIIIDRQWLMR